MIRALLLSITLGLLSTALAQDIGAFHVERDTDPFTDANRSYILTLPIDARSGRTADNLGFGLKCLSDGLNVVVIWGKYFGGDRNDRVEVRYRIDDLPSPTATMWVMFSAQDSAWMPMNLVPDFTAQLRRGSRLMLRVVDPLDGETITNEFSLARFSEALDAILPCN